MSEDIDRGPFASFKAVQEREPVVLQVHRELRQAILRGHINAGERLIETQISAQLAVSRTPVREAISRLEAEGLVLRLANGGVEVAKFIQKLAEVLTIRQSLECAAVRLACKNASDEELFNILRGCREAMRLEPGQEARSEHDRKFHLGIAKASGNKRLLSLMEEFYEYSFAAIGIEPQEEARKKLQIHHLEIASALLQRDTRDAEALIIEHFEEVQRIASTHGGPPFINGAAT